MIVKGNAKSKEGTTILTLRVPVWVENAINEEVRDRIIAGEGRVYANTIASKALQKAFRHKKPKA